MLNSIELLKREHKDIERELIELNTIIFEANSTGEINYPNLIHVFKNLTKLWDSHEIKEEKVFPILKKEKIRMPVRTMLFDHSRLKPHRDAIKSALESGSNLRLKEALDNHGKLIIQELQSHIDYEDDVLYTITLAEFTKEELKELFSVLE